MFPGMRLGFQIETLFRRPMPCSDTPQRARNDGEVLSVDSADCREHVGHVRCTCQSFASGYGLLQHVLTPRPGR